MCLFGKQQRIVVWGMQSNGEPHTSPEKQKKGMHFYGPGRRCGEQSAHGRKLKVRSTVTFSLAALWQSSIG